MVYSPSASAAPCNYAQGSDAAMGRAQDGPIDGVVQVTSVLSPVRSICVEARIMTTSISTIGAVR